MKRKLFNQRNQVNILTSRRGFLKNTTIAAMGTLLGAEIVFGNKLAKGLIPIALTGDQNSIVPGKHSGLILLNDRPLNVETPPH